jgi:hypothetical protein
VRVADEPRHGAKPALSAISSPVIIPVSLSPFSFTFFEAWRVRHHPSGTHLRSQLYFGGIVFLIKAEQNRMAARRVGRGTQTDAAKASTRRRSVRLPGAKHGAVELEIPDTRTGESANTIREYRASRVWLCRVLVP